MIIDYLGYIAVGAVFVVLLLGLFNMFRGGSANTSQKLMRWRVGLQFLAIIVLMCAAIASGTMRWYTITMTVSSIRQTSTTQIGLFESCTTVETVSATGGVVTSGMTCFTNLGINNQPGFTCPDGSRDGSTPNADIAATKGMLLFGIITASLVMFATLWNLVYPMRWLWTTQIPLALLAVIGLIVAPSIFSKAVKQVICSKSTCEYQRAVIGSANSALLQCTEDYGYSMGLAAASAGLSGVVLVLCCIVAWYAWLELRPLIPAKGPNAPNVRYEYVEGHRPMSPRGPPQLSQPRANVPNGTPRGLTPRGERNPMEAYEEAQRAAQNAQWNQREPNTFERASNRLERASNGLEKANNAFEKASNVYDNAETAYGHGAAVAQALPQSFDRPW